MIGRSGERGSGISVLPARYDDDDDIYIYCSSRRMALALNNLKRFDMPLNKETEPERYEVSVFKTLI